MMKYLHLLEKADLLMLLKTGKRGISRLNKPEKVYLENTNLMYALTASDANRGNMRETFLCNQLSEGNSVEYPESGDFKVNDKFTIEVGEGTKHESRLQGCLILLSRQIILSMPIRTQSRCGCSGSCIRLNQEEAKMKIRELKSRLPDVPYNKDWKGLS